MENSKKGNLPLRHGIKISKDLCLKIDKELDRMSRVPYAFSIGSIMYAMTCTRPDVSFALSMVSRHQHNLGEGYWTAVKNILKYLRNTKDSFLVYGGEEVLKVTTVTWKSSKQDTVADSTCESEYIVACEASKEAIWMKNFIGDLGVIPTVQDPIEIFCDNESAIALTKEPKDHRKSKHIERKYHFVQSKVEEGHVIVKHIRSEDNPADPFTKALAKSRHDEHARNIGGFVLTFLASFRKNPTIISKLEKNALWDLWIKGGGDEVIDCLKLDHSDDEWEQEYGQRNH
ncbi:hypothetical protein Tco_0067517 [Tanacetum coccineum]